jgi:hypothetical protein
MDLADILGFFIGPSDEDVFQKSISSKIIEPAIRLFEGFQTATDEYYFETSNWVNPGRRLSGSVPDSQVLGVINSLDCRNVARIMAAFKPTRLRPSPSIANLRKDLFFVCSLRPALVVRYKGEKKNSEIVTQQRVLVAWDPAHLVGGDVTVRKTATWLSAVRDGALKYLSQTTRYD